MKHGFGTRRNRLSQRLGRVVLGGSAMLVASAAAAQTAAGPVDGLMEDLHLKAHVAPAPDFVTRSRSPKPADFIPVGTPHPERATRVMTPAEVAAAEADLDTARERQQRRAGRTPARVPLKPPGEAPGRKNTVR